MVEKDVVLGSDFDGVLVDDVVLMLKILKEMDPERYQSVSERDLNLLSPIRNLERYPELLADKIDFMRDGRYIRDLSPCAGVPPSVPLVRIFCNKMYLLSARWIDQDEPIEAVFQNWGISGQFDAKFLRDVDSKESALEVKLRNAKRAGVTHVVENEPEIALAFVEADDIEGVAFIVKFQEKNVIPNSSKLRKYGSFNDFVMDVVNHRSIRAVFSQQNDPENWDKIYEVNPICSDPCGLPKICTVSGQYAFSHPEPVLINPQKGRN